MIMSIPSSEILVQEINSLAGAVGFRHEEEPRDDHVSNSSGLDLWVSGYALLILITADDAGEKALEEAFLEANAWMADALKVEEKVGRFLDGYLLIALHAKPDESLLAHVRRVERDTSVCRKHVLWPDADGTWARTLSFVTTLGLPSAVPASGCATGACDFRVSGSRPR